MEPRRAPYLDKHGRREEKHMHDFKAICEEHPHSQAYPDPDYSLSSRSFKSSDASVVTSYPGYADDSLPVKCIPRPKLTPMVEPASLREAVHVKIPELCQSQSREFPQHNPKGPKGQAPRKLQPVLSAERRDTPTQPRIGHLETIASGPAPLPPPPPRPIAAVNKQARRPMRVNGKTRGVMPSRTQLSTEVCTCQKKVAACIMGVVVIALLGILTWLVAFSVRSHFLTLSGSMRITEGHMTFEKGDDEYNIYSNDFCHTLEKALVLDTSLHTYLECNVTDMRNGSVIIDYSMKFETTDDDDLTDSANEQLEVARREGGPIHKKYGHTEILEPLNSIKKPPKGTVATISTTIATSTTAPVCTCNDPSGFCLNTPIEGNNIMCPCTSCKCSNDTESHINPSCNATETYNFKECKGPTNETLVGVFPDPEDCFSFYQCDMSGKSQLTSCANSTVFNPMIQTCDHSSDWCAGVG